MYSTFSHTFSSPTHGEKKFYLTFTKGAKEPTFDGKINDDKAVKNFKMKKEDGQWKIQPEATLPDWVMALEPTFAQEIEARAAR